MNGIDDIPWHQLHHAYGTAEDVPGLIKKLQTASPDLQNEESPLWHLFGNIWHQGTVYEATSYAVPFLIELATNPATPDRCGVLSLLAAIAYGTSYLDVHQPAFEKMNLDVAGGVGSTEYESKKVKELRWVAEAIGAVEHGFDDFARLARENTDVGYCATNVLTRLPNHRSETLNLVLQNLAIENRELYRAGLLLLMGELRLDEPRVWEVIDSAAQSESKLEQRAAAIASVRIPGNENPGEHLVSAIVDAMCDLSIDDDLFAGLPWDWQENIDFPALFNRDQPELEAAAPIVLALCDSDKYAIYRACDLFFETYGNCSKEKLTPIQSQVIEKIIELYDRGAISSFPFSTYGIPESFRELRSWITGQPQPTIDQSLPLFGCYDNPKKPFRLKAIKVGDQIHHQVFGLGTVEGIEPRDEGQFGFSIRFEQEGLHFFGFPIPVFNYHKELAKYYFNKLIGR